MSIRAPRRFATFIALPTAVAAGVAFGAPAFFGSPALAGHEEKYKGSAQALQVRLGLLNNELLNLDLPMGQVLFPDGGDATLLELPENLASTVKLKVLSEETGLNDEKVLVSTAETANLGVLQDLVAAEVIKAQCTAKDLDVEGDSSVAGLTIAGTKVPVDPGPNFKIEIPEALETAGLSGGVFIDEQIDLEGGGKQINAIRIALKLDPAGVSEALKAVSATVRAAAQQLEGAIEQMTGKSLEDLLIAQKDGEGSLLDERAGAAQDQKESRGAASERVQRPAAGAEIAASTAETGGSQAPAAAEETAVADQAQATDEAALDQQSSAKEDGAAVDHQATEQQAQDASAEAGQVEVTDGQAESADVAQSRVERDAKAAGSETRAAEAAQNETTATDSAAAGTDAAAAERAERAAATDRAIEAQQAKNAEATAKAGQAREADRAANTGSDKADGARLSSEDRASAPTKPAVEAEALGLVGLEVIVSQVECTGAKAPAPKPEVKEKPKPEPKELPETGGDSDMARNLTATGLALLTAGSAAVFVSRRRRSGGLHAK